MFYDIKDIFFYTMFLDLFIVILLTITNHLTEPYHSLVDCFLITVVTTALYKIVFYQIIFIRPINDINAFFYKGRIVSLSGFSRTLSSEKNILTPQLIVEFDFWDSCESGFITLTPDSCHWHFFVFLANLNPWFWPDNLESL